MPESYLGYYIFQLIGLIFRGPDMLLILLLVLAFVLPLRY